MKQLVPECEHGRMPNICKDRGGRSLCEHGRQRSRCKDCGGKGICEDKRRQIIKDKDVTGELPPDLHGDDPEQCVGVGPASGDCFSNGD